MPKNKHVIFGRVLKIAATAALAVLVFSFYSVLRPISVDKVFSQRDNFVKLTGLDRNPGGATGFEVIAPSGKVYTITNDHVCDIAIGKELALNGHSELDDTRVTKLAILEKSILTDLCILEAMPGSSGFTVSDVYFPNESVFIIGHPHLESLQPSFGYLLSKGFHSILMNTPLEDCNLPKHMIETMPFSMFGMEGSIRVCTLRLIEIETSMVSYPGNSGSPVFNQHGEVIGVLNASTSDTNHGIIIPLEQLKAFIERY